MKMQTTKRGVVLSENAMFASVHISMFNTLVKDGDKARELAHANDAAVGSTKVRKKILTDAFPRTTRAASRVRSIFYHHTFPLPKNGGGQQKGPQILPTKIAEPFISQVTEAIDDFHHAADKECTALPRWIESEKIRLGRMFKESDYPTPIEARDQFYASVSVDGLPSIESINAGAHTKTMKAQATDRQDNIIDEVKRQLLIRLLEAVSHVANECKKEKGKIYPSLLGNVRELIDLIPSCNIDDDQELNDLVSEAKKILRYSDDQIKATPTAKDFVAGQAAKVAKSVGQAAKQAGVKTLPKSCQQKSAQYF